MFGKTFGASLLLAGCAIGAGMLGMPLATVKAGFTPTLFVFLFAWFYMTIAAFQLLKVALKFPEETNLAEMAKNYFGKAGQGIVLFLMLFLMYALMTAYAAFVGPLIALYIPISPLFGSALFVLILFITLIFGTKAIDYFNRYFMAGLGITYLGLMSFGLPHVELKNLSGGSFFEAIAITPILIVSFGFHNLIPSLVRYLEKKESALKSAIVVGSIIPLVVYLLWEFLILGIMQDHSRNLTSIDELLFQVSNNPAVFHFIAFFAFFAITTSFMGNALSTLDFIMDQAGGKKGKKKRASFALLTVLPPLLVAIYNPNIFLTALQAAGSFSAVLLFGIIPALMSLKAGVNRSYKMLAVFLVVFGAFVMLSPYIA
ncbi:MAG: amino acid permease [Parachlamydiaceae bacterium]